MPHLYSYRQGWQSENLALYFLYQFSFVARPWNIADDIGADYYCTRFELADGRYLHPKSAFAIQIKSNAAEVDISNKLDYLANLQMPFFVGIIDKAEGTMSVYSGEYIPLFFCLLGNPLDPKNTLRYKGQRSKVVIRYVSHQPHPMEYWGLDGDEYTIFFPLVGSVKLGSDGTDISQLSSAIEERSVHAQANIAALRVGSYVFTHWKTEARTTIAGSSSIKTFRTNLQHRMAETFHNLMYLYKEHPDEFDIEEFRRSERAFFAAGFNPIDPLLQRLYKQAKESIEGTSGPSTDSTNGTTGFATGASASSVG